MDKFQSLADLARPTEMLCEESGLRELRNRIMLSKLREIRQECGIEAKDYIQEKSDCLELSQSGEFCRTRGWRDKSLSATIFYELKVPRRKNWRRFRSSEQAQYRVGNRTSLGGGRR